MLGAVTRRYDACGGERKGGNAVQCSGVEWRGVEEGVRTCCFLCLSSCFCCSAPNGPAVSRALLGPSLSSSLCGRGKEATGVYSFTHFHC